MQWKRWLPALLVMSFIFGFSSLPAQKVQQLSEPGINLLNHMINQIAPNGPKEVEWLDFGHAIGYLLLASAFYYALTSYPKVKAPAFSALFYSFLYSLTDEFHQLFVPGRSSEFKDILIDTIAASLALLVILSVKHIRNNKKISQSR
jgi:VanZ family protein